MTTTPGSLLRKPSPEAAEGPDQTLRSALRAPQFELRVWRCASPSASDFGFRISRPRAFAFLLALAMIVLVAAAFVSLASLYSQQLHRTVDQHAQAQLRQLLTAAGRVAPQAVTLWTPDDSDTRYLVNLPDELAPPNATLKLWIEPRSAGLERLVHIEATIGMAPPLPPGEGRGEGKPPKPSPEAAEGPDSATPTPHPARASQTLRFVQSDRGWGLLESNLD